MEIKIKCCDCPHYNKESGLCEKVQEKFGQDVYLKLNSSCIWFSDNCELKDNDE